MNESIRWFSRFQWRTTLFFILVFAITLSVATPGFARKKRARPTYPAIRDIIIDNKDIFDPTVPGEGAWPFRAANALHFRTKETVVRRELLVKPGDTADKDKLDESERLLRTLPFIKDARIKTVPTGDGRVDVIVETHDTWTTQPQVNFGSEGGENEFSSGITEENVFGYGKKFSYLYNDDSEGVGHEYAYKDPQLFGTRLKFDSSYTDTGTGSAEHVALARPFFSLTTLFAGGVDWDHFDQQQNVITNGVQSTTFNQQHHDTDAFLGMRMNDDPESVHRLSLHYIHIADHYYGTVSTVPDTLPANKVIAGPQPQWNWLQSRFIKETFIDRAERVEDFNLGHELELSAGYAARALGSTDSAVPFAFVDQFGTGKEGGSFSLFSYGIVGRFMTYSASRDQGTLDNTLYFVNANYYKHLPTEFPFTAVFHGESAYVQHMDSDTQLELGGDTGMRAFKNSAFTGNKSILFNAEARAFYPHEVLHLAYLGGACFVDVGQLQPPGSPYNFDDTRASIGVGFRMALTRSSGGSVYRFDVAYAVGRVNNQDKRIVFSISSGQAFNRHANTFEKFPRLPIKTN